MEEAMAAEPGLRSDPQYYRDQLGHPIEHAIAAFDQVVKSYGIFTCLFLTLLAFEVILFAFFFTWLWQASILAISLSAIVLTLFAYFLLRIYFQTRKPLLLQRIRDDYAEACREFHAHREELPDSHIVQANAYTRLASTLQGREFTYYSLPHWMHWLQTSQEKLSDWWHWEDVLRMRELLLLAAVDEHLLLVRREPTSLEVHTALANSYVTLSGLYVDPRRSANDDTWSSSPEVLADHRRKFRVAAERAIEEFKILNDYAPNDPWIHTQLAYSYHDLQMPDSEIREYEIILKLRPDDRDTLFRLGRLSFQQGLNAKGLRVYEILQRYGDKRAEHLISYYGDYQPAT